MTMNSIDANQAETNRADLNGLEAVAKIREIADKAKTCFFCTSLTAGIASTSRPMSVLRVDDRGDLWFLSASDSRHNQELADDPVVRLYFQASAHAGFLQLSGLANITTDAAIIKDLWQPVFKTWFTGGLEDPRITAIRVSPTDGYYWDNKHGNFIAGIKMLLGAALGTTLDDSIQGTLTT